MGSAILRLKNGQSVKLAKAATHEVTVTTSGATEMRTDFSGLLVSKQQAPKEGLEAMLEIDGKEAVPVRIETMEQTGRYRRLVGKIVAKPAR